MDQQTNTLTNTELYSHKNIPIETLINYRNKGLSYRQIAKLAGCSSVNVFHRLKYSEDEIIETEGYSENRAWVFDNLGKRLLLSITDDEIKSLNPYQRVVATGILYDKYRLETNQSTSNMGLSGQIEHLLSNPDTLTKLASTIRDRRRASIVGDNAIDGRDSGNDLHGSSHPGCDNPSISPGNEDVIDIIDDNSNVR